MSWRTGSAELCEKPPAMQSIKQVAHELIDNLPEQATWDDVMYTLYVRQKLERSLQAAKEGKVTSQKDVEKLFLDHPRVKP